MEQREIFFWFTKPTLNNIIQGWFCKLKWNYVNLHQCKGKARTNDHLQNSFIFIDWSFIHLLMTFRPHTTPWSARLSIPNQLKPLDLRKNDVHIHSCDFWKLNWERSCPSVQIQNFCSSACAVVFRWATPALCSDDVLRWRIMSWIAPLVSVCPLWLLCIKKKTIKSPPLTVVS